MGARGPAPTPSKILELRGSRALENRQAEPEYPVEKPSCPAWLGKEAKAEWRRQVDWLHKLGIVAKVDRAALAAYCEAWGEFVEAVWFIEENGRTVTCGESGYVQAHPMVAIKNKAADRLLKLAAQFGFTPSARARIKAPPKKDDKSGGKSRFFRAG